MVEKGRWSNRLSTEHDGQPNVRLDDEGSRIERTNGLEKEMRAGAASLIWNQISR